MASTRKTATSSEADEEEFEDYEEVEMEEDVEDEEYEEAFEEEEEEEPIEQNEGEEEEPIEQNDVEEEEELTEQNEGEEEEEVEQNEEAEDIEQEKEEEEGEKKFVEVLKVVVEGQSAQVAVRAEKRSLNPQQPSETEGNALQPHMGFSPFLQSVRDLEKFNCALSKFFYQWHSLNRHLESVTAAIDAHEPSQDDARPTQKGKDERCEQENEKDERSKQEKDDSRWVHKLCQEMQGKTLRKYIESNLSDVDRLRQEVSEALRRIPVPEKLVFEAIGKFYKQGSRGYKNNEPLVSARRGSILLLEFFVFSGRPTVDSSVKEEAEVAALLWWKRLVDENIESVSEVDSLGLILFLACFGIPKDFCSKDLCLLLLKSNLKKNIDVFLRSNSLVEKIPGVIKDLIKGEMYMEAAELSCCFGLTDAFPPLHLLTSFISNVYRIGRRERKELRGFPKLIHEANVRQLKSLRSVAKYLKDHKFDMRNFASLYIEDKISNYEEYVKRDEMKSKRILRKRKAEHLHLNNEFKTQSQESFRSTSEACQSPPSQMIQDNSEQGLPPQLLFPDSKMENSAHSVTKDYPFGWEEKYLEASTGYRSLAMKYPSTQHFYQPQASVYGNSSRSSAGRNLYQFADTVLQHESQLAGSNNTFPAAARFGHH